MQRDLADRSTLAALDDEGLKSRISREAPPLAVDHQHPAYGEALRFYLILTHWPELAKAAAGSEGVLYGRYFWFRKFSNQYFREHGRDAGIEQQLFQILELADVPVDWSVIEMLDARALED